MTARFIAFEGGEAAGKSAFDIITNFSQMTLPELLLESYSPGADAFAFTWEQIVLAAEKHNDPGNFTAFIGFEWTSVPKGFNLHRNVLLRDGAVRALQVVPPVTQPPFGDTDPNMLRLTASVVVPPENGDIIVGLDPRHQGQSGAVGQPHLLDLLHLSWGQFDTCGTWGDWTCDVMTWQTGHLLAVRRHLQVVVGHHVVDQGLGRH